MVELKRWIAKDASDHGQLISDSDLTDESIFDRLENDVVFRSVATTLAQRYGYLQPTIDPDSPAGKQQDLLIKERVKWLAQEEEEERTAARQARSGEPTRICDPRTSNCATQSVTNPLQQIPQTGTNQGPTQVPGMQTPQNSPGTPYSPPQRTQPRPAAPEDRTPQVVRPPSRPTFSHAQRVPDGSFRFLP